MAPPSSVRALEQWGSEDEPQGEQTVSILRFIIHWPDPGRRQPLLEEAERRGGIRGRRVLEQPVSRPSQRAEPGPGGATTLAEFSSATSTHVAPALC